MIEEQARVLKVEGGFVEIETERRSACGSCSANAGCGTSLLATWFPQRHLRFRLRNDVSAGVGDRVIVGLDEDLLQRGSMMLYALPLAGLLIGTLAGEYGFRFAGLPSELGAVLMGLLGLIAALILVGRWSAGRNWGGGRGMRLMRVIRHHPEIGVSGQMAVPGTDKLEGFRTYK